MEGGQNNIEQIYAGYLNYFIPLIDISENWDLWYQCQ